MKLSGWGRYPVVAARLKVPRTSRDLQELILSEPTLVARGNGRAYGDSAINASATIDMRKFNRMIAFDVHTGQLVAEAGVLLGDVISTFLPRGWFPLVTPGTKFVTLGGAIAADVHGKNHHKDGSFRSCVEWVEVMGPGGEIVRCSEKKDAALFDHTVGGMGLTGIIVRAAIRLRPVESAWIKQKTIPTPNLQAAMAAFESSCDAAYSVAWIDTMGTGKNLGRSLVMLGEHAARSDLSPARAAEPFRVKAKLGVAVPIDFPPIVLNGLSVRVFNSLYYWGGAFKAGERMVDWNSYFYPLDAILGWNRIYGRNGFSQFQCVLPLGSSEDGLASLLEEISKAGLGSFLAVLKKFGKQHSAFSFPMEGYTLALDFPINGKTLALLERLDQITIDHGGRFYLAKDSRMTAGTFRASERRLDDFQCYRESGGCTRRFRSAQSERLAL